MALLTSLSLVACNDDEAPSPSALRAQISRDLPYVLGQAQQALDTSTASLPTIPSQLSSQVGALAMAALKFRALAPALDRGKQQTQHLVDPPATGTFDPAATAQWLNDNLFTDANHLGGGVYRRRG
ncbi:MAG: hypothetical protein NT062_17755 [Proteobacteria bacterium]|nr:hypothetical protein [Pseudomonadota bacterium]